MQTTFTIATRASPLALWQAEFVQSALKKAYPQFQFPLLKLTTTGDRFLQAPLRNQGGKGLFIKELEEAMQDGRAQLAVHSLKDLPMQLPEPFTIAAICKRENPNDCLVSLTPYSLEQLPANSKIGTASLRRQLQCKLKRPDCHYEMIRGNIHTRLGKLKEKQFDALILAAAGLERMNFFEDEQLHIQVFSSDQMLAAAGQGALVIESLKNSEAQTLLATLNDFETELRVTAERALCKALDGGCQIPLAAFAEIQHQNGENQLRLRAQIIHPQTLKSLETDITASITSKTQAQQLGERAASDLIAQGAQTIIDLLRHSSIDEY